jgi:hypothetical protein
MSTLRGGCVCGAIRYECTGDPVLAFNCHCRDCQHLSGGAYAPVLYFSADRFALINGELRRYATESMRGGVNVRGFCGECGTRVTGAESERGIGILVATLDDPSGFRPQFDIHVAQAQPWDRLDSTIPKFDGYPPI